MMDSQNINSFISNFNYASTPDNLGQTFYNEESSIEQRSFTNAADPVNMQSNQLAGLPGWTMKGKGLDSPRWLSTVSITAIIDLLLKSYPNFSLKSVHNVLRLPGESILSPSPRLWSTSWPTGGCKRRSTTPHCFFSSQSSKNGTWPRLGELIYLLLFKAACFSSRHLFRTLQLHIWFS